MIDDTELKARFKGGGSFISVPTQFSDDGQFVYVAWKNVVYCYNSKTGKRFLQFQGMESNIVGFGLFFVEEIEMVCACGEDGVVHLWKANTGVRLKKMTIPLKKVKTFKVLKTDARNRTRAVVSWKKKNQISFGLLNLDDASLDCIEWTLKKKSRYALDVGGPRDDMFLAVIQERHLNIIKLNQHSKVNTFVTEEDRRFTCIACHPENECIITGDNTGRVLLWQNLTNKIPTRATFHWHTLPVKSVCFSTSGSSFYSGGTENVLVKWNLEDHRDRKFLPRLPSSIEQIAVAQDNLYVAVGTADNGVQILSAQFDLISVVQHLVLGEKFPAGMSFDPRTKALVMNGISGHLQFYSPRDLHLLYNLDISGTNKLTGERNVEIVNTEVTKVSISRSGMWMATVEEYGCEDDLLFETRLKFWMFNNSKQTFELNTSIEYPHSEKLTDLKFQPLTKDTHLRCVTTGKDNFFKIWQLVDASSVYTKGDAWRCSGAAYYRDLSPNTVAFSYDGSLLAIGFDKILTTWLPDSCDLKCSLLHPFYRSNISQVAFGTGSQCHLLVSSSHSYLSVWNLLTLNMLWTVPLNVAHLVSDIMTPHMAVFTVDNKLFVFEPNKPNPIYTNKTLVEAGRNVVAAVFVPNTYITNARRNWYQKSLLFYIDSAKELYCVDNNEENVEALHFTFDETQTSLLSQIMPGVKSKTVAAAQPVTHSYSKSGRSKKLYELLDTPAHTMIPISLLCQSILNTMVLEKSNPSMAIVEDVTEEIMEIADEVKEEESVNYDKLNYSFKWTASVF